MLVEVLVAKKLMKNQEIKKKREELRRKLSKAELELKLKKEMLEKHKQKGQTSEVLLRSIEAAEKNVKVISIQLEALN